MFGTHSNRLGYIAVALFGAAAGGLFVALTTRAVPKLMSGMMGGMMHKMTSEMMGPAGKAGGMCERMMAGMEQSPKPAACDSVGGTDHGIH